MECGDVLMRKLHEDSLGSWRLQIVTLGQRARSGEMPSLSRAHFDLADHAYQIAGPATTIIVQWSMPYRRT